MNPLHLDCDFSCVPAAVALNRDCACLTVDRERLQAVLQGAGGTPVLADLRVSRPHLFSDALVFVAEAHLQTMAAVVAAIENIVRLPAWQAQALAALPATAAARRSPPPAAAGVFLGYDFHLGRDGPQLIEINTNAGGGFLAARLAQAQRACCEQVAHLPWLADGAEAAFVAMFADEWQAERGDAPLRRIAIVDDDPAAQYLAPEFELCRQRFEQQGWQAVIADPRELDFDGARLLYRGEPVDLVYNRLTDFALEESAHAALRAAWLAAVVVVTPHPLAHALFADKRNLVTLSDDARLQALGVTDEVRQLLRQTIPRTVPVTAAEAAQFWQTRKQWFFKPAAGFGSRAAYRGDKLTTRVFEEILAAGDYVAQALVPPPQRRLPLLDGEGGSVGSQDAGAGAAAVQELKFDLRNYAYRGRVQLVAARLYQGQTTNFRTPGGGFASVLAVPCADKIC